MEIKGEEHPNVGAKGYREMRGVWLRRDDQRMWPKKGGLGVMERGWPKRGRLTVGGHYWSGWPWSRAAPPARPAPQPPGPTMPSPLLACSALKVRDSAGGGLQVVGSTSRVACTFGFFSHRELGRKWNCRGPGGRRSRWSRGCWKPLRLRLGKRMGMVVAAQTPLGG